MAEPIFINPEEYFTGQFYTRTTAVERPDVFRDERIATLMEIEGQVQATLLSFWDGSFSAYFYVDEFGALQSFSDIATYNNVNNLRWIIPGGASPPRYMVIHTGSGSPVYLDPGFGTTPILPVSTLPPPNVMPRDAYVLDDHFDFLSTDGHTIYRMTVPFLTLNISFLGDEPDRIQPITVQQGHPNAYRSGRTFYPALIEVGDLSYELPQSEIGFGGVAFPKQSVIKLGLHNEARESIQFIKGQDWRGRKYTLHIGLSTLEGDDFPITLEGRIKNAVWSDRDHTLSLTSQDKSLFLQQSLQENTYAGTGGYEGDPELTGQLKPFLAGYAEYFEPVLVNRQLNLYQFHDGPARSLGRVLPGGIHRTSGGNFPNGLLTWDPTETQVQNGIYRTDLARGMFRLAGPAAARVIVQSAEGDTSIPATSYPAEIIWGLIQAKVPEAQLDLPSFNDHITRYPFRSGRYYRENVRLIDVANFFLRSTGSALILNPLDRFTFKPMQRDEPIAIIEDADLVEDTNVDREEPPVTGRQYLWGYQHVHTVLTESDFLGNAEPLFKHITVQADRFTGGESLPSSISDRFPDGPMIEVPTGFASRDDSNFVRQLVRFRQLTFRDVLKLETHTYGWLFRPGDLVHLRMPEHGIDQLQLGIIVSVRELSTATSGGNRTQLRIWTGGHL